MSDLQNLLSSPAGLALAAIGALTLSCYAWNFIKLVTKSFIVPGYNLKKFGAKNGRWAVVTGATDGIGREFALQLAKAGFNVFIASRSMDKLEAVRKEINDANSGTNVQVQVHAIDFSRRDAQAEGEWSRLGDALKKLDIGVLVNNVGKSYDIPAYFDDVPTKDNEDIVQININATMRMTQIALPAMLTKKNGLILNIGSFAGSVPGPMLATYSASKAFLSTWSQALADEYKSRGIVVEHVHTYFVVSAMSKIRKPSLLIPTAKTYVRSVLKHIGTGAGAMPGVTATTTPYWPQAFMSWFIGYLPRWFTIRWTHNLHIDIRKRALKKREREAALAAKTK
ncbi:hypothetical protein M407DRAFT_240809 [Tulasnella calospora MUT 4182]|uniref:Very-long-chain 3-oxoacyl-CoA reductase n=1 Tax=Tulasnella calospora MUT 4182 TaxID=1051891 RepID=A0A0C3LIS9_9AGAM|nr:hypothetical protein M407DRAFT_240809 [Tulasnella calospora MUT 4182]